MNMNIFSASELFLFRTSNAKTKKKQLFDMNLKKKKVTCA